MSISKEKAPYNTSVDHSPGQTFVRLMLCCIVGGGPTVFLVIETLPHVLRSTVLLATPRYRNTEGRILILL